ncbi:hypothetical protein BKI52_11565 [marine bacterium AO1-C]|nr:hypothetical protein BKI52_11565 [marine bacterium AO1-C]
MKSISLPISEGLFVLIKSLKKSEKRNFKLFINKQTKMDGINTYLRLFNAIDKQDNYNEELLIKKLKFSQRKLAYTKHLLYELVLKSLRHLHDERNPDFKLRTLLANTEILYQKALYRQSYKMLLKAKKLALETENYSYLPDVLRWSAQLFFHSLENSTPQHALGLIEDHKRITAKLNQELILKGIRETIFCFQCKHYVANTSEEQANLELLMNHPLLKLKPDNFSFQAKLAYLEINGMYFQLINHPKKAFQCYEKLVLLWDQNPKFRQLKSERHRQHLFVFLKLGLINRNHLNYLSWFTKFDQTPVVNAQEDTEKQALSLCLKKLYYFLNNVNGYKEGAETLRQSAGSSFTLNYHLSLIYFSQNKPSKALLHLNKVFYHPVTKTLSYKQQGFIKILELLLHYDLGNLNSIDHLHKSVYRFIHKYRKEAGFERMVIKYLKKLYNANNPSPVLLAFEQELRAFSKNLIPWQAFEQELLFTWIKSKIPKDVDQERKPTMLRKSGS